MSDFSRPKDGFRFLFGGINLNSPPDAIPPNKFAVAVNVRAYSGNSVEGRPGQVQIFATGGNPVTDISSYTTLNSDEVPRYLARDTQDKIWLDTSVQVGTLTSGGLGATMIPIRPNESPVPYIYIANGADYQKFSAPPVTASKVGIAEPQSAPDLTFVTPIFYNMSASWTEGGTASAITPGTRVSDTVGVVFPDPNNSLLQSVQVTSTKSFQRWMTIKDATLSSITGLITDVFPPLPLPLSIAAITYFSGSTGRCIIVPTSLGGLGADKSINQFQSLTALRRGAIIHIVGGTAEYCLVLSVTLGPNGTVCIETSTVATYAAGAAFTAVPTIQVYMPGTIVAGHAIIASKFSYSVTTGIGTQTTTAIGSNPFTQSAISLQPADYISLGVLVDDLTLLNEMKLQFDVDDGSFTKNFYYVTIRSSDLAAAVANTETQVAAAQTASQLAQVDELSVLTSAGQLATNAGGQILPGASQWTQLLIPISSLTRVGTDDTKTLQSTVAVQILWNASGTINISTDVSPVFMGTYQPDVGDIGEPYRYRVRPRSSVTGVRGNPSPATRYGLSPRRIEIKVLLPSAAYDSQIDTWDIFRFGGSVTSWRYIGSTPSSNSFFIDNYPDEAAQAGDALDFDNFQPWPSIDVPFQSTASQVTGTIALVALGAATAANLLRYLPGNLVQIAGQNVYTLRSRPVLISGTTYRFEFEENASSASAVAIAIYEPALANQPLPYMFGPDAAGTVFACGDPLRAGTLSFSKNYAPDSAPDSYNIEITPPSEPLLGGLIVDGLAFVASSDEWWALYPQPSNPTQRFNVVQQPFPRGLAAPFGLCTDNVSLFWWAKDGIYSSSKGSLTDADLYALFPHEGVTGEDIVYNGVTVYAPDYARAGTFRLTFSNSYLYATYQDRNGLYNQLVLDVPKMAWSVDVYATKVSTFYHPKQPAGTLLTNSTRYEELVMGNVGGIVAIQTLHSNDLNTPIPGYLGTFEYDGGDIRAPKQWGDLFLDLVPSAPSGVIATPMSLGAGVAAPTTIPQSSVRTRQSISVGGVVVSDFMGLFLSWTEDYRAQNFPTQLNTWQPSFDIQPARTIGWATFGSSYGQSGYMHIREVVMAYVSSADITLTITSYDGQSPAAITLPSTGGVYKKVVFPVSANKGQLYKFQATCPAEFQFFEDDCEIRVGAWNRNTAYSIYKSLGGANVAGAPI